MYMIFVCDADDAGDACFFLSTEIYKESPFVITSHAANQLSIIRKLKADRTIINYNANKVERVNKLIIYVLFEAHKRRVNSFCRTVNYHKDAAN